MFYPKSLNKLIESFKKLPGIGDKTAERMALSVLQFDKESTDVFAQAISDVNEKIKKCPLCHHLTEEDKCYICKDKNRNDDILCIVEEPKDVISLEKIGAFKGRYHVLGGLISPSDGINPEDINISSLVDRIKNKKIKEVIIALKSSIEGETTALYISKVLSGLDLKISKIAYGLPIGVDIEYIDALTLERALEDRIDIS
ncbi:MAG: recombination mediator RecR [Bacilli bacterium]